MITNRIMKSQKSKSLFSTYLHINAQKLQTLVKSQEDPIQCEVVAVCGTASSKDKKSEKGATLHKDFKTFHGFLDSLAESNEVSTAAGSACVWRFYPGDANAIAQHLLFLGVGQDAEGINAFGAEERMRRLGAYLFKKMSAEKFTSVAVHLDSFALAASKLNLDAQTLARCFAEGAGLAAYSFTKYFSKTHDSKSVPSITLVTKEASRLAAFERGIAEAHCIVKGTEIGRDFGNEPSNTLYPESYAERCKKLAAEYGMKFTVLDEKDMKKEKMGLLLGVGQGSVNPPRLFVMDYNPGKKAKKTLALVGKGITFDSGGISIKPSSRMEDMKHDMCGSAAVIGATVASAMLKLPVRVICVVAAAENMPSGNAIQPGNVLTSRCGKTVEVNNTDAEGRLVLSDALDYTQDMNPDYIIDAATLTGAASITMGKAASCLMSNDEGLTKLMKKAAENSGERVWELPLFEEYFDDLKSDFADMRNTGDNGNAGTARAAIFMLQFIRKGTKWAHIDLAALAYGVSHIPYNPKKFASGYGVRLFTEVAKLL